MFNIDEALKDFPIITLDKGQNLLIQGVKTDSLYFLVDGEVSIIRDGVEIATSSDKGAVFGEMSIMLDNEHSATVKCTKESKFYQLGHPTDFLKTHPEVIWHITKILSHRLYNVNNYLIDTKHKYDNDLHMKIVDETLKLLQEQS